MKYLCSLGGMLLCMWMQTSLQAQPTSTDLNEDPEASAFIQEGKHWLNQGELDSAVWYFWSAANRPPSTVSSAAYYFSGLTQLKLSADSEARYWFEKLVREFPRSRYVPEAQYQFALHHLRNPYSPRVKSALATLVQLVDSVGLEDLRKDARQSLKAYLFELADSSTLVWGYRKFPSQRLMFIEVACYRQLQLGDTYAAKLRYRRHLERGGVRSFFLERMMDERLEIRHVDRDVVKVAVFLPLHLQEADTRDTSSIPRRSALALEYYEGFRLALENLESVEGRKVLLKVFDTRRDSMFMVEQMGLLDEFYPDLVMGAVYNISSRILSDWAEATGTPQLIPLSPTGDLTEERTQVFQATSTLQVHGRNLARFAVDSLKLSRVGVWTIPQKSTLDLARSFSETFSTLGGTVLALDLEAGLKQDKTVVRTIRDMVKSLRIQRLDAIYLPIYSDEETAGLILNEISVQGLEIKVLGGPHIWKRFDDIDRDLKDAYEIVFTHSFFPEKQSPEYTEFENQYWESFQSLPTNYQLQGYDMGQYVYHVLNNWPITEMTLAAYLRNHPPYKGIHQTFDFKGGQINQFVHIGGFREGQVIKLNETIVPRLKWEWTPDR
ncbi:MAG: ABC transporter substrate-binding protein [Bacteroidota bacterium]